MINVRELIGNPQLIEEMRSNIIARNSNGDVDEVVRLYGEQLSSNRRVAQLRTQANANATETRSAEGAERQRFIEAGRALKEQISAETEQGKPVTKAFQEAAMRLPNWMSPDVPRGSSDADNNVVATFLQPTRFDFTPKDHLQLGKKLDLIDFERGAKVAGPKFYFLKNEMVLLQHAIKSYAFRKAIEHGFKCLHTPDVAKNSVLQGIGFSPRGSESNTYELQGEDMSLVATAEIAVGGMHANDVFNADDLPLLYAAESHCFRREAGQAGRSSKGLYRVHQFEKVELFAFSTPSQSARVHEQIRSLEEEIYQDLRLPYRVVLNCAGDLGAPAYKKYDIEAWMPGKDEGGAYGEVTSASNCTDYQSRRLNIRFKDLASGKTDFVHTLNGTAVALSRTLVAIMENYQTRDGGIRIPEPLVPYMGMSEITPKAKRHTSQAKGCRL